MKKSLTLIITVLTIALMASTAFCWTNTKGGMNKGSKAHRGRACQNLSPEQLDQLKALHQKFIDDTVKERTEIAGLRMKMKMIMETSTPDKEELVSIVEKLGPLQTEMAVKRIDFQLAAKKISPDFQGFGMGRGPGMGRGHGMGQGPGKGSGFGNHGRCLGALSADTPERPAPEQQQAQ